LRDTAYIIIAFTATLGELKVIDDPEIDRLYACQPSCPITDGKNI